MALVSYSASVAASAPYQWWRLRDASGSTVAVNELTSSFSGILGSYMGFTGSVSGTASYPNTGSYYNWFTQSTQSLYVSGGAAIYITGTEASVVCSGILAAQTELYTPWSIEFWYRPDLTNAYQENILGKFVVSATFDKGWGIRRQNNSYFYMSYYYWKTTTHATIDVYWINPAIAASKFTHYAVVVSASSTGEELPSKFTTLYIDGVQQAPGYDSNTAILAASSIANSGALMIGGWYPYASNQVGQTAWQDVAFYTRALSATEILEHFNAGFAEWANPISSSTTMDSGTLPTGSFKQINIVGPLTMKNITYVAPSTGSVGGTSRATKTNPGTN